MILINTRLFSPMLKTRDNSLTNKRSFEKIGNALPINCSQKSFAPSGMTFLIILRIGKNLPILEEERR
jgi:hypothetical protein